MSDTVKHEPGKSSPLIRRFLITTALLVTAFLLGFIPTWLKAREHASELTELRGELALVRMQNTLASGAIDARRGDYEAARLAASSFFTSLRAEADKGDVSALTETQKGAVQGLFVHRDEIITLLARSDPASVDRLAALYVSFRQIINSQKAPQRAAAPPGEHDSPISKL
jgi:hypothetical protein